MAEENQGSINQQSQSTTSPQPKKDDSKNKLWLVIAILDAILIAGGAYVYGVNNSYTAAVRNIFIQQSPIITEAPEPTSAVEPTEEPRPTEEEEPIPTERPEPTDEPEPIVEAPNPTEEETVTPF